MVVGPPESWGVLEREPGCFPGRDTKWGQGGTSVWRFSGQYPPVPGRDSYQCAFLRKPPIGTLGLGGQPPLPTSLTQSLECSRTRLVLSLRRERGTDSPGREFISSPETLNRLSPGLGLSFPAGVTGRCSGRATVLTAERGDSSGPEGPEERPGVLLPQVSAWPPLGSPVSQPQLQLAWQWG